MLLCKTRRGYSKCLVIVVSPPLTVSKTITENVHGLQQLTKFSETVRIEKCVENRNGDDEFSKY